MKKLLALALFALPLLSQAQVITDFTQLSGDNYGATWGSSLTFNSGIATVGAGATADSGFEYANVQAGSLNFTNGLLLEYVARVDVGNLSNSFKIRFADAGGDYIYETEVITTGWTPGAWTTGTIAVTGAPQGLVSFFTFAGDGTANAFRMSFDNLKVATSAVPEPSSFAALAGLGILGVVATRRRRSA